MTADIIETIVEEFGPDGTLVKRTTTRTPRNRDTFTPYWPYGSAGGWIHKTPYETYITS